MDSFQLCAKKLAKFVCLCGPLYTGLLCNCSRLSSALRVSIIKETLHHDAVVMWFTLGLHSFCITDTIRACQSLHTVTMYIHKTGNIFKPLMDH